MRTFGWILFVFNIIGLFLCVYNLQFGLNITYLFAAGLFLAQIIYNAKMIKILKKFGAAQEILEGATKKAGLQMARIFSGKKKI